LQKTHLFRKPSSGGVQLGQMNKQMADY